MFCIEFDRNLPFACAFVIGATSVCSALSKFRSPRFLFVPRLVRVHAAVSYRLGPKDRSARTDGGREFSLVETPSLK